MPTIRRFRPSRRCAGGLSALLPLLLLAPLALACGPGEPAPVPTADLERASEAVAGFREDLAAELITALEEGPEHAIHVCSERAHALAAAHSPGDVEMGRTSHRLRNPDNAPRPWVEPLLADYLELPDAAAAQPRAVRLGDGTFGYVEPIVAQAMCMSCHGPAVEEELAAEIRSVYPEDEATGFKVGDLRGLFWVRMPLTEGGEETSREAPAESG